MNNKYNVLGFILALSTTFFANTSQAGCHINIMVKNTGKYTVGITVNKESAAKGKGGLWRALKKGNWKSSSFRVKPGQKAGGVYKGIAKCKHRRRYRIRYTCTAGQYRFSSFNAYYPSPNGWTRRTDITIKMPKCKK